MSARALLDRAVTAKGGADVLRRIRTLRATSRSMYPADIGGGETAVTTFLAYPDRMRVETRAGGSVMIQGFDGAHAWIGDARETLDVPAEAARGIEASLRRDTVALLLAALDGRLRTRLLPDIRDEDGTVYHALEVSDLRLDPIVLHIDPVSGLVMRQTYVGRGPGAPLVEERFEDYRVVHGVAMAFAASVRSGGRTIVERRVTDIQVNPPLDPRLFSRPVS
jgi:hypothetical protein